MLFLNNSGGGGGGSSGGGSSNGGGLFSSFFGKKPDPNELVKEWRRNLNREARAIDRTIANIQRQEQRALKECKTLCKAGRPEQAKILAREVVAARKTVERMYTTKAQLSSVGTQLQQQLSMIKMQGSLAKSTEIMKLMNGLVKVSEINASMTSMAREMERSGLIEELMSDAIDSAIGGEALDAEADAEVDRVVTELTANVMSGARSAPATRVVGKTTAAGEEVKNADADAETEELLRRLQAL